MICRHAERRSRLFRCIAGDSRAIVPRNPAMTIRASVAAALAAVALPLLGAADARAASVQVTFTGSFSTGTQAPFALNRPFLGSLTFDTAGDAEDQDADAGVGYYTGILQSLSLTIDDGNPIGAPSTTIAGPLTVGSSAITITNSSSVDSYLLSATILNGPTVSTTQSNGFQRHATLTEVWVESSQNSNPIDSDDLTASLFDAFIPHAGVQPQRFRLFFTPQPGAELNTNYYATVTPQTTVLGPSPVPVPAALPLLGSGLGLLGLAGWRRRRPRRCPLKPKTGPGGRRMRGILGAAVAAMAGLAAGGAHAVAVTPVGYSMLNGMTGSYTYFDDTYDGSGNPNVARSALSGGTGDLTDGVVASGSWFITEPPAGPGPYVGWSSVSTGGVPPVPDPTIQFLFSGPMSFNSLTLYFDDADGGGGVDNPAAVRVNGTTIGMPEPGGSGPAAFTAVLGGLLTDTLTVQLVHKTTWIMLSEVTFDAAVVSAVPVPAALPLLGSGLGLLGLAGWRRGRRRAA